MLPSFLARFSVCTPYPGTEYFKDLHDDQRIVESHAKKFDQYNLVFRHKNLSSKSIRTLLDKAYRRYYTRPLVILRLLIELLKTR